VIYAFSKQEIVEFMENLDSEKLIEQYRRYDKYLTGIVIFDVISFSVVMYFIFTTYGNIPTSAIDSLNLPLWVWVIGGIQFATAACFWVIDASKGDIYKKLHPEESISTRSKRYLLFWSILILYAAIMFWIEEMGYFDDILSSSIFLFLLILIVFIMVMIKNRNRNI